MDDTPETVLSADTVEDGRNQHGASDRQQHPYRDVQLFEGFRIAARQPELERGLDQDQGDVPVVR